MQVETPMLVSHKHRFIFIHAPKTGGRSICRTLLPYADCSAAELKERFGLHGHAGLADAIRVFGEDFVSECFTFAFERNPWDKCVSLYYYQLQYWDVFRKPWRSRDPSFSQWFFPFGFWPKKLHTAFHLYSLRGEVAVDFLGKYENLQSDFNHVCRSIGIPELVLPHSNQTHSRNRREYHELYTDRMRRRVERVFRREIELLGYQF
jgi:hypothetical protein